MDRYKEIKEQIRSRYNSLPKNHRKIADYFINNFAIMWRLFGEFLFHTISQSLPRLAIF